MTGALAHAGAINTLTAQQRHAAATGEKNIFIEAGPGTGKTTVSAQRFGVHRFAARYRHDARAVVAVSFTRAATFNLRRRVQRLWGTEALAWPHRVVTLDTIMSDLFHDLLREELVEWPDAKKLWPGGDVKLDVRDSWASCGGTSSTRSIYELGLNGKAVTFRSAFAEDYANRVPAVSILPHMRQGICTHDDVRTILEHALHRPNCAARIQARLGQQIRALVVDEVFDANELDIAILESAIAAGVAVTLVGDPWQALYLFRGAKPQVVRDFLDRNGIPTLRLTQSFRWQSEEQAELATNLRNGARVTLPIDSDDIDVAIALYWKDLWAVGGGVLPLAYHSFKGGYEEAAATLLLNHATRNILDLDATYLGDALAALNIQDRDIPRQLEPQLQGVIETLQPGTPAAIKAAYNQLVTVVGAVSARYLRPPHAAHTKRLTMLQSRLTHSGRPVPGLTTHQAKGGEWDIVGVVLSDTERSSLGVGLSVTQDTHRKIYVATTRARYRTIEVMSAPPPPSKRAAGKTAKSTTAKHIAGLT
ncbi:UvrD-helicase domain-containing protein [Granulicoccus phenolivorans]|uniref:UvrD-helicase domain-containing protein n=1 Tax=Granulicoccus phenolivorans TaxID=266854 RepID=UPI0004278B78|nr:UvrD-helicase domain-containing protein [Granulicoccus phenolivorans]MEA5052464.1 UvrD-helicase domain-containing protein [Propionicimonas sp.]